MHHIIPRCIGGTDSHENLVKLTAREHYIAHLLLTKMLEGNARYKLQIALWRMCSFKSGRYVPNNSAYQQAKENMAEALSKLNKGKSLPIKQRLSMKGKPAHNKGKKMPSSQGEKISMYRKSMDKTTAEKINLKISKSLISYHEIRASKGQNRCPKYKWELHNPDTNEVVFTTNLKDWCKSRGFSSAMIYKGSSKWKIISKHRIRDNARLI